MCDNILDLLLCLPKRGSKRKLKKKELVFVQASWGRALFSAASPSDWLPFTLPSAATPTSVLISTNRNGGNVKGTVQLNSTGLILGTARDKPSDWNITFAVILIRPDSSPPNSVVIVAYLMLDGQFIPLTGGNLQQADRASFVVLDPSGPPMIAQRSIRLADLPGGTALSIAAANVSAPSPVAVSVIQWSISAEKIENGVREISCPRSHALCC